MARLNISPLEALSSGHPERNAAVELSLAGRSILVVEDEPFIAMDVVQGLQAKGASVSEASFVDLDGTSWSEDRPAPKAARRPRRKR